MNEIYEFEGEEFEVAPHRLEEFLQKLQIEIYNELDNLN